MKMSFLAPFPWRYWVAAAWLVVTAAAEEREPNLTGIYDDEGTVVTTAVGRASDGVSLHALFKLEFVPALARILHEQTAQIRIKHHRASLEVEITDPDGKVIWQGAWQHAEGYAIRDGRVVLHFKPGKFGQDEFLLLLKTITVHRLLEVEVQRLTPTLLGPSVHPVGTYLFPRLPEESEMAEKR
ncbi:MAG TPA: hypothetical protein VIM71_02045 [Lacunisphaera sp.]